MIHRWTSSVRRRATLVLFFFVFVTSAAIAETTFYVNGACGNDSWTATSSDCQAPDGPKATIQAGIDASMDGDTVFVADGTYTGDGNRDLDFAGRLITLRSENGPERCIIDCEGTSDDPHRGFFFHNQETADATLEGFTIQNGYVIRDGPGGRFGGGVKISGTSVTLTDCTFRWNHAEKGLGGGIFTNSSSATLINCTFSGNSADDDGGGMYNEFSTPTLTDCTFSENSARYGGGMYNYFSSPVVTNCVFIRNRGDPYGGGIFNLNSSPVVTNCTFTGNWGSALGGGMVNDYLSHPTVTNCTFSKNSADYGGGMFNVGGSSPTVTNCTFSENSAPGHGGGAICSYDKDDGHHAVPIVSNCVLWGNTPEEILNVDGASTTLRYSNIQGGWPGEGNIDEDPLFVPGPLGCYYLSQIAAGQAVDSPCADAGDPASPLVDGTTRSDEGVDTGVVDMGYHHRISGRPLVMGDSDHDGDVDFADFAGLQICFTGEGTVDVIPCCRIFDFGPDQDVDLDDFAAFHTAFTGP